MAPASTMGDCGAAVRSMSRYAGWRRSALGRSPRALLATISSSLRRALARPRPLPRAACAPVHLACRRVCCRLFGNGIPYEAEEAVRAEESLLAERAREKKALQAKLDELLLLRNTQPAHFDGARARF